MDARGIRRVTIQKKRNEKTASSSTTAGCFLIFRPFNKANRYIIGFHCFRVCHTHFIALRGINVFEKSHDMNDCL